MVTVRRFANASGQDFNVELTAEVEGERDVVRCRVWHHLFKDQILFLFKREQGSLCRVGRRGCLAFEAQILLVIERQTAQIFDDAGFVLAKRRS